MKWGILGVEVFAVVASYLILTLPAASATSVKIYSGQSYLSATYNPWYMLDKDVVINPPWDSPTVSIGISNSTSGAVVERVLLYRCRGMNPSACVSAVQAESSQGNLETEFAWTSLADQTANYPQQANILVMARVNNQGKPLWAGFWIEIERDSEQGFDVSEDDLDSLSVYVNNIEYINMVKQFITGNQMIPANPLWVSRVVLDSATSIYELEFDQSGDVEGQVVSGNEVTSVSSNCTLMLPEVLGIRSPVVLYKNPSYICGDSRCEDGSGGTEDRGEGQGNCCLDCPCSSGWYCDSQWGCRPESGIALSLYGSAEIGVSNCYEIHDLDILVEFQNAPSGMSMDPAWYSLRGVQYETECTPLSGSIYRCPVTVPVIPDCTEETEGMFTLGPNRIGVQVSFPDGAQTMTKDLEVGLPDITIGSFKCGQGGCETGLGEDHTNCCYDCPCPSGYCDYEPGSLKTDAYCRQDPQESNIRAAGIEPDHFTVFSESGKIVDMNIVVRNAPRSLGVSVTSCDAVCLRGEESCTATCSVTGCSELASSDPEEYNMSCTLFLYIDDYDMESDYTLSPSMGFSLGYNNGSGSVTGSITQGFRDIPVGAQRCGDGDCIGSESAENCCYDCPCAEDSAFGPDYYCDTRDINGPTTGEGGDSCKPLSGTGLIIDEIGGLSLKDSTKPQVIKIRGHVPDPASDFAISGICSMANDPDIDCIVYCQVTGVTDAGYGVVCDIKIPPIGYTTIGLPYYECSDPDNRVLRLQPNSYNITLSYNDGPDKREDFYSEPALGRVEIAVTSHCGEGSGDPPVMCEVGLGEDQTSCCLDCGCSDFGEDFFCYTGETPDGLCMKNNTILLEIIGFKPYPLGCTIGYIRGPCGFSKVNASVHVINAPPDIEVVDAFYTLKGQSVKKTTCVPGKEHGNFTCPLLPDNLGGTEGSETRELNISLDIRYYIGDVEVLQSINASTGEEITRKKSQALMGCENEISRLQGQINHLDSNADDYEMWADIMHMIAIALFVAFAICMIASTGTGGGTTTPPCVPIPGVTMCVQGLGEVPVVEGSYVSLAGGGTLSFGAMDCMGFLMMAMQAMMMAMMMGNSAQSADMQRMSLEMQLEQKRLMCSSEGFPGLADATGGMMPI